MANNERIVLLFTSLGVLLILSRYFSWIQVSFFLILIYLAPRRKQFFLLLKNFPRDARFLYKLFRVFTHNRNLRRQNASPASMLSQRAADMPDATCFIFKERSWTYRQMEEYSWKVARIFSQLGFSRGDVVALDSGNRPEFAAIWIGLSRLGIVTALVNTNLRRNALLHTLTVSSARAVIASSDLCAAIVEVKPSLNADCVFMRTCGADQPSLEDESLPEGFLSLDQMVRNSLCVPIEGLDPPNYNDRLLYVYTSGTTGLPKAAIIPNSRYLFVTVASMYLLPIHSTDRLYNPLPMYHLAGGIMGVGPAIIFGVTTVIRDKFSAAAYWKDCQKHNCTIGQHIGEMCRYILAVPPSPSDKNHSVRLVVGNGLRPAIWKQYVQRFGVPRVVELYGATEGNANIVNVDGTVGAVGFLPFLLPDRFNPLCLIRVDLETGELVRTGPHGLCVRCQPGEPGMLVGRILKGDPTREFHGYLDHSASEKKIARNVFTPGDKVFLTGDILVMDESRYIYFKDRTGDTFRWKGENVSTAEVEATISSAIGLRDACVYGVEIPNMEGRAGMATILDAENNLDINVLGKALADALPIYAQPLFLRISRKIDLTGTYKIKKTEYQKEGFNPEQISDRLLFRTGNKGEYCELTKEIYRDILNGAVRL